MPKNDVLIFYGTFSKGQAYDWIPYGPIFVSELVRSAGFNPVLIHEYKDGNYEGTIRKHAKNALVFGVSAMTGYQLESGIKAVEIFRKYSQDDTPVIFAGAHATADPYGTLNSGIADYVYVGQVGNNFIDFLNALKEGKNSEIQITDILSLDYFRNLNTHRYCLKSRSLDLSVFPASNLENYDFSYLLTPNMVLNYTASIGCYGRCTFCSWGGGAHSWVALPIKRVINDIKGLVRKYNLSSIWFCDSSLTARKSYLLELAQGLVDEDLNIYWRCNGRAQELKGFTKQDYALLEMAGLDRFFVGVENVNPRIQKAYSKVVNPDMLTKIITDIRDFDIQIMLSFIFGNPVGPLTDLEENKAYLDKWRLINSKVKFQNCFYTPYPGTPLAELAAEKGYKVPLNLEGYASDSYFLDVDRFNINAGIPWFSPEEYSDYIKRYHKLFSKTDCSADWNWRKEALRAFKKS